MYTRPQSGSVPNYTSAFLVSFGVLIFMLLVAICTIWGLLASVFGGWVMDRAIVIGRNFSQFRRSVRQ